jgi:PTH1 family peptidyl-tRNA hydrolase
MSSTVWCPLECGGKGATKAIVHPTYEDRRLILAKPQTYMNLSGQSAQGLLNFYKLPMEHMLIAHDDLDIPFGTIRMRPGGGPGGQRGVASTIERLGTKDFARLRLGIGRPPHDPAAASRISRRKRSSFELFHRAADAAGAQVNGSDKG